MTWHDERYWPEIRARQEREALAASVEEIISEQAGRGEDWDEERAASEGVIPHVIPPRMGLRTRTDLATSAPATTNAIPTPLATGRSQRLGRSTRVRLQAVRADPTTEVVATENVPAVLPPGPSYPAPVPERLLPAPIEQPTALAAQVSQWPNLPGGKGMVLQGQSATTVANAAITERSVVNVMLAGNPGPVVVQYISLHPRMGFTIHLSASATADAPFNYLIWPL